MKKILLAIMLILCCVYLDSVDQPSSVEIGERFMITVTGNYESGGDHAWLAMMVPIGFQVDSVAYRTSDTIAGVLTEVDTLLSAYIDSIYPCDSQMCWQGFTTDLLNPESIGTYVARVYILVTDLTMPGEYLIDYLSGYGEYYSIGDSIFDQPMIVNSSAVNEQTADHPSRFMSVWPSVFSDRVTITVWDVDQDISRSAGGVSEYQSIGEPELKIFDISGRVVKSFRLTPDALRTTHVTWTGRDDQDRVLPSGMYFIQLIADEYVETEKVLLVR